MDNNINNNINLVGVRYVLNSPWAPAFEGEGGAAGGTGDAGAGSGSAGGGDGAGGAGATGGGEVVFTPEQKAAVDKLIKDAENKSGEKVSKVMSELKALQDRSDLTATQRSELERRVENINKELLTKEQLFEQEKKKTEQKYIADLEGVTKDRDSWKTRFIESTIVRAITDAAATNQAFNTQDIVAILRPQTSLEDVLDGDGHPTGDVAPKVKFQEVVDGKQTELVLAVPEAVKRMSESESHLHLFKGEGAGGYGGNSRTGGKKPALADVASDPKAYREARKAGTI